MTYKAIIRRRKGRAFFTLPYKRSWRAVKMQKKGVVPPAPRGPEGLAQDQFIHLILYKILQTPLCEPRPGFRFYLAQSLLIQTSLAQVRNNSRSSGLNAS